jgi:hypothetical protein
MSIKSFVVRAARIVRGSIYRLFPAGREKSLNEAERFVREAYLAILKRPADDSGLKAYVGALLSGRLDRKDLMQTLIDSDEKRRSMIAEFQHSPEFAPSQGERTAVITHLSALGQNLIPRLLPMGSAARNANVLGTVNYWTNVKENPAQLAECLDRATVVALYLEIRR